MYPRQEIEELIASGITAHKVAKDTGISRNTIYRIFNKESSLNNITLLNAEKLSSYWREHKENIEVHISRQSSMEKETD